MKCGEHKASLSFLGSVAGLLLQPFPTEGPAGPPVRTPGPQWQSCPELLLASCSRGLRTCAPCPFLAPHGCRQEGSPCTFIGAKCPDDQGGSISSSPATPETSRAAAPKAIPKGLQLPWVVNGHLNRSISEETVLGPHCLLWVKGGSDVAEDPICIGAMVESRSCCGCKG